MRPADAILLAQFMQVFREAYNLLSSCQEIRNEYILEFLQHMERDDRLVCESMVNSIVLHQHRLSSVFVLLGSAELGDWVKARSTTWYSCFLMTQYDDQRWIEHFRVTREVVQELTVKLKPLMFRKNTRYRFATPIGIRVACALYKLAHAADYLQCNEMFEIGKSTVHLVLHEFVCAINSVFKGQIMWPEGQDMKKVITGFKDLCGLPSVHGAIDATQIHIMKPKGEFAADYYSFKSKGYSFHLQAVVDHQKRFTNVFVGIPGSVSDTRVLRLSTLYNKAFFGGLMDPERGSSDGIRPYLLGDKGYPLLPWLMTPHKLLANTAHTVLQTLFNRRLSRGRVVTENAFGILKKLFRELFSKSTLDVVFLCDVVVCCCMLHNMILGGKDVDVVLVQLDRENLAQLDREIQNVAQHPLEQPAGVLHADAQVEADTSLEGNEVLGTEQRQILEIFLGNQRPPRL